MVFCRVCFDIEIMNYFVETSRLEGYLIIETLLLKSILDALTLLICYDWFLILGVEGIPHETNHLFLIDGGDITVTEGFIVIDFGEVLREGSLLLLLTFEFDDLLFQVEIMLVHILKLQSHHL